MTATDFPAGGGAMGARIRAHDWSASPIGPPEAWPQSLRAPLSLALHSGFPAYLAWGPDLVSFYNDAYVPILGTKPDALGRPFREVWPEVWDDVSPIVARVLSGHASYFEDLPLTLERRGYPEKTWWTFSYSPTFNETGGVGGMLCIVHETTEHVLAERRLRFLDDLSGRMHGLSDPREVMAVAAERLGRHLAAGRAGYGEVDVTGTMFTVERDWTDGAMPSFVGGHNLNDFGLPIMGELKTGHTIRLDDALTDPRTAGTSVAAAFAAIGMRAGISAPFMDSGQIAATLYVHQAKSRRWRDDEVALMEEVAGRTWEAVRRARAERALRESEARLQAAIDLVGLAPYAWDPKSGALHCDDRLRAMWGLPPETHVDVDVFLAAIHPEDRPRVEAAITRCIDPGGDGVYQVEHRVIGVEDGVKRWVSTRGQTLFSHARPIWFTGAALDITERKRAEAQMHKSEQRFRQFADHSTNVLWILDAETSRLEYLSRACEQVWGESRDVLMQDWSRWTERLHPDDRERVLDVFEGVLGGDTTTCEYRIVRADTSVRWIRDTLFPIRDEHGRVRQAAGFAQDITWPRGGGKVAYVVDGDEAARQALTHVLQGASYEVKVFTTARAFLDAAPVLVPGCAVLDVTAVNGGCLTILRELRARRIGLPVVATGERRGDVGLAVQALKAGAIDYLEAPYTTEALLAAVASALADIQEAAGSDRAAEDARTRVAALSAREREVLDGLLSGGTNKTIAKELGISPRTVEIHRAHLMDRLGAQTLPEAVLKATAGLNPSPSPNEVSRRAMAGGDGRPSGRGSVANRTDFDRPNPCA